MSLSQPRLICIDCDANEQQNESIIGTVEQVEAY